MTDRLRQIWGDFEGTTTRRLTGRGVENIDVPHRRDWSAEAQQELAEGVPAPAEAAFAELKFRLSAAEQKAAKKAARKRRRRGERHDYSDAPPAPLSVDALPDGAPKAAQELIRGLKATEARVERSEGLYTTHMAAASERTSVKRKKFLGLF